LRVKRLRHAGRAARVAQGEHGRLEDLAGALHAQGLAAAQRSRRLGALPVDFDLAGLDRLPGQAAGLVEARRPQPQVEADGVVRVGGMPGHVGNANGRPGAAVAGCLLRAIYSAAAAAAAAASALALALPARSSLMRAL